MIAGALLLTTTLATPVAVDPQTRVAPPPASTCDKPVLNKTYVANAFFTATPFGSNYVPSIGAKRRIGASLSFDF